MIAVLLWDAMLFALAVYGVVRWRRHRRGLGRCVFCRHRQDFPACVCGFCVPARVPGGGGPATAGDCECDGECPCCADGCSCCSWSPTVVRGEG